MVEEVRIYVEGGGDGKAGKTEIRRGFGEFLSQLRDHARSQRIRWSVFACGSRRDAFDDFRTAIRTNPNVFNVLLVDSDGPVSDAPWRHLQNTVGWQKPEADDDQCQLMVQVMEAWLVADVEALKHFYGQDFRETAIPRQQNVEQIEKTDLERALDNATRHTKKGRYHKIKHGAKLLAKVDPAIVREKAQHCKQLFTTLTSRMTP